MKPSRTQSSAPLYSQPPLPTTSKPSMTQDVQLNRVPGCTTTIKQSERIPSLRPPRAAKSKPSCNPLHPFRAFPMSRNAKQDQVSKRSVLQPHDPATGLRLLQQPTCILHRQNKASCNINPPNNNIGAVVQRGKSKEDARYWQHDPITGSRGSVHSRFEQRFWSQCTSVKISSLDWARVASGCILSLPSNQNRYSLT